MLPKIKVISSLVLILVLVCMQLQAQWRLLPLPMGLPGEYGSFVIPGTVTPYADQNIIYASTAKRGSHDRDNFIHKSHNDLYSQKLEYPYYSNYYKDYTLNAFHVSEDSSVSFVLGRTALEVYYNFKILFGLGASEAIATAISPNFVYSVFRGQGGYDSIWVLKTPKNFIQTALIALKGALKEYIPKPDKLSFVNDSLGYTITGFKTNPSKTALIRTMDYGRSWSQLIADSVSAVVDYQVLKDGSVYVLRSNGTVSRITSQGVLPLGRPPLLTYMSLRFKEDGVGYLGGLNGILFKTEDGGISWTKEKSNTDEGIAKIRLFDESAYFVDASGRVYKSSTVPATYTGVSIFPSPFQDSFTVLFDAEGGDPGVFPEASLEVKSMSGQEVCNLALRSYRTEIDMRAYPSGVYFITVFTRDNVFKTKLIKL
jgi:hypothetical protein